MKMGAWPYPNWNARIRDAAVTYVEKSDQQMLKVLPIKKRTGPIDRVQFYDGPDANNLRMALFSVTQGFIMSQNRNVTSAVTMPGIEYHFLTRTADYEDVPASWRSLIQPETRRIARNRLRLDY
jgi:hypothetical protein